MKAIISNDNWVRCGKCRHKLFKILNRIYTENESGTIVLESKCSSCKELNVTMFGIRRKDA